MEAIDTKAIKDAVCKNNGYRDWNHFLDVLSCGEPIEEVQESVFNEVISEVAKQVAERQRKLCSNEYKKQKNGFWININNNILNCDSPEII